MDAAKKKLEDTESEAKALMDALDKTFDKEYKLKIDSSALDKYSGIGVTSKNLPGTNTPIMYLQEYATGGLPSQGEIYVARESGPELVGTIGGSNAVVNNQDIVASVSQGVAQAVASVLGSGSNVTVTLEGDAKGLFKVVQKEGRAYSARTGQPALA